MNRRIVQASLFTVLMILVIGIAAVISAEQTVSALEGRVQNTVLLWSEPLGEKILQGEGRATFTPLLTWLKDNEPLINEFKVDAPGKPETGNVIEIPFMYHGAELYTIKGYINTSELIFLVAMSPLFLAILFLTIISGLIFWALRLRHLARQAALETEMQWQEEKIRWSRQVAHDLRQPLSCLKIVSHNMQKNDISAGDLQLLSQTVERIEKTSQDLLQVKKPELPQLGASSLREVVIEIVDEFRATHPKIEWSLSGDLMLAGNARGQDLVPLKKNKLQRVISNVLSNAVEVSKSGQTVYVGISNTEDFVVFECLDEGPGFEENVLREIGKKEVTGKADGHGLGLFDISILMNHLGGELHIESQKGIGSRVQLSFPSIQR